MGQRYAVAEWLSQFCEVLSLQKSTYYLALQYLDACIEHFTVRDFPSILKDLQPLQLLECLSLACLFLSAKFNEVKPPCPLTLIHKASNDPHLSSQQVTRLIQVERVLLSQVLQWRTHRTPEDVCLEIHWQSLEGSHHLQETADDDPLVC
jgi:hypothetical protein